MNADSMADAATPNESAWNDVNSRIARAAPRGGVTLVAVGKTRPPAAIRALASFGARTFGENYVQEALAKQLALADLRLEWHAIGPLQSNKARDVARHFDWLQTLDREKLIEPLARHRDAGVPPLNVLIQVNIDDEASKSGCAPAAVPRLAAGIAGHPRLRLRGLMAIPAPLDLARRREAFRRMRALFDALAAKQAGIDTLSMGMSDDFELAIEEGATMVRVGSALFGPRSRDSGVGIRDSA
jgi:hypothetical protein